MQWFNSLKVGTRFVVIAAFIAPFLLGLGGAGVWGIFQINDLVQHTQEHQLPSIYTLGRAVEYIQAARIYNRQALLENDLDKAQADIAKANDSATLAYKNWQAYTQVADQDQETVTLWPEFESAWNHFVLENTHAQSLALPNTPQAKLKGLEILANGSGNQLSELASQLATLNFEGTATKAAASQQTFNLVLAVIIISALGTLFILVIAGMILARSIITMTTNLTHLNAQMTTALASIEQKRHFGETVSSRLQLMTTGLNATSNQQKVGSQQQAAAIAQVTSSLAELSQTAQNIAGSAQLIDQVASQVLSSTQLVKTTTFATSEVGQQGQQAVDKTIGANERVSQFNQALRQILLNLQHRSQELEGINSLIKSINSETHLLSLNAAIEAAGAGAYGERFGVVANQVKLLADQSMNASRDINLILSNVQNQIEQAVVNAESGQRETESAVMIAQEAGAVINELIRAIEQNTEEVVRIEQAVGSMTELTQEIGLATNQQHSASALTVEALQGVGIVANQTASSSLQVNTTVSELEKLSRELTLALAA